MEDIAPVIGDFYQYRERFERAERIEQEAMAELWHDMYMRHNKEIEMLSIRHQEEIRKTFTPYRVGWPKHPKLSSTPGILHAQ